MNANFIKSVRALFGERRVKIVVEDVEEIPVPDQKLILCSVHAISETSYLLSRLNIQSDEITNMINIIFSDSTASITIAHFKRAIELAKTIGFHHINDRLHTAIAEEYCD